jgi:hypothetical protein
MTNSPAPSPLSSPAGRPYARLVKPAALVALGVLIGSMAPGLTAPAPATAQSEPPFNAAEQRKQMIAQLSQMNDRLARIEGKLDKTVNVKVTEMPPVIVKDSGK